MSFVEQERVLFDLLFDARLRRDFCQQPVDVLGRYDLSIQEQEDFRTIRQDALEVDARMRLYMTLSLLCRDLPLSFAIASTMPDCAAMFRDLVDIALMRTPVTDRVVAYGSRLRERLVNHGVFASETEQAMVMAIVGAEISMAFMYSSLRRKADQADDLKADDVTQASLVADWSERPASLADNVCAIIMPRPYGSLKQQLCPGPDDQLWAMLDNQPLSRAILTDALREEDPRLLIVRGVITETARCEPVVSRQMIELSEGFVPLLQYINGENSVDSLLAQLAQAGAASVMLQGVKQGFAELVQARVIRFGWGEVDEL